MIGLTLCSGIGAPEMAAPWVDWRLASEIEAFPRAVLQARFGYQLTDDHQQGAPLLWGDMTEVSPDLMRRYGLPLPDVIVAGTPCQAFSIAGLRKGTADARGNLTLKFVEILHEFVAARPDGKLAVLWENVPGVLSDKGNAFGCFLGGIVGAVDALPPPADASWPGEGMVEGPRARAAWAVLDAQYFGVAQRRRRLFVVVDFGGCIDPAAILLEPESLRGNPPARGKAGEVAPTIPARSTGGGGLGTDFDCDGGLIASHDPAATLQTTCDDYSRADGFNMIAHRSLNEGQTPIVTRATAVQGEITHALTAEGHDASEDGTGRGTPIIAFSSKDYGADAMNDLSPTLRAGGHDGSHANAGVPPAVAFDLRGREGGAMPEGPHDTVSLRAASGGSSRSYIATPWAVRRLMPIEAARLQGFPDNHTQIPWRGKPADQCPDGPQYKAYGNSMAVPNIRWIMDRIRISWDAHR